MQKFSSVDSLSWADYYKFLQHLEGRKNMADTNLWTIVGSLGQYPKEGTSKTGKPWRLESVGVYDGKDKEGKSKFQNIKFFVPGDDIETFRSLAQGTKLRLNGRPDVNSYVNKEGETIVTLGIKLAWDNPYEILEDSNQQSFDDGPVEDGQPF